MVNENCEKHTPPTSTRIFFRVNTIFKKMPSNDEEQIKEIHVRILDSHTILLADVVDLYYS